MAFSPMVPGKALGLSEQTDYQIETIEFRLKQIKEKISVVIYKPQQFKSTELIKVLYMLDGEYTMERFQKLHALFKDYESEFMVVGIVKPESKGNELLTRYADKYLSFLTKKLIPEIEKGFKSTNRILLGHGYAGAFTIYTLISKPTFFNSYISISPFPVNSPCDRKYFLESDEMLNNKVNLRIVVSARDSKQVKDGITELAQIMNYKFQNIIQKIEMTSSTLSSYDY